MIPANIILHHLRVYFTPLGVQVFLKNRTYGNDNEMATSDVGVIQPSDPGGFNFGFNSRSSQCAFCGDFGLDA